MSIQLQKPLSERVADMVRQHAELRVENQKHLKEAQNAIADAVKKAMKEYHEATGLHLTSVEAEISIHLAHHAVDYSVLTGLYVKSNMPPLPSLSSTSD